MQAARRSDVGRRRQGLARLVGKLLPQACQRQPGQAPGFLETKPERTSFRSREQRNQPGTEKHYRQRSFHETILSADDANVKWRPATRAAMNY